MRLRSPWKGSPVAGLAIGLYVLIVLIASFHFNISLTPDRVILLIALIGLTTGRARQFLKDWSIFLIVLIAWQVLSGFSRNFGHLKPHVTEMIVVDKALFFGQVPTIWLQRHFYTPGHLHWYDIASAVLYMLHFVFPMAVAFAIWFWKRQVFGEFMVAFLILALAGFTTFVLFPAAPPWLAASWGYLPHVYRVFNASIHFFGGQQSFSALYQWLWNQHLWDRVAAVPSEHAAFPFLCFLYARSLWHRAGWTILGYCFGVWLAVVYMGEHYVTDLIVGVVYACVVYAVVRHVLAPHWADRTQPGEERRAEPVVDSLPA